jgi:hypothetical protein
VNYVRTPAHTKKFILGALLWLYPFNFLALAFNLNNFKVENEEA